MGAGGGPALAIGIGGGGGHGGLTLRGGTQSGEWYLDRGHVGNPMFSCCGSSGGGGGAPSGTGGKGAKGAKGASGRQRVFGTTLSLMLEEDMAEGREHVPAVLVRAPPPSGAPPPPDASAKGCVRRLPPRQGCGRRARGGRGAGGDAHSSTAGMEPEGIFRRSPNAAKLRAVREAYNAGDPINFDE